MLKIIAAFSVAAVLSTPVMAFENDSLAATSSKPGQDKATAALPQSPVPATEAALVSPSTGTAPAGSPDRHGCGSKNETVYLTN